MTEFEAFVQYVTEMVDSTLCVCGHRLDEHGETGAKPCSVRWYDHATGSEFCGCVTFRPTFYRDGER